jgi:hypothetical protein
LFVGEAIELAEGGIENGKVGFGTDVGKPQSKERPSQARAVAALMKIESASELRNLWEESEELGS